MVTEQDSVVNFIIHPSIIHPPGKDKWAPPAQPEGVIVILHALSSPTAKKIKIREHFWDPIQKFAPFLKGLPKNTRGPEFSQAARNFRQAARTDGQLTAEDRTMWRGRKRRVGERASQPAKGWDNIVPSEIY